VSSGSAVSPGPVVDSGVSALPLTSSALTDLLIAELLTRYLGEPQQQHPPSHPLCQMLQICSEVQMSVVEDEQPPLRGAAVSGVPDQPEVPKLRSWPDGPTVQKRLGLGDLEMHDQYQTLRRPLARVKHFDVERLLAFFPAPLWPALEQLITDGPSVARLRADEALILRARIPVKATRDRASGPPSRNTLLGQRRPLHMIFRLLKEMRDEKRPYPQLDSWSFAPKLALPDVPENLQSREAPCPRQVRLRWEQLRKRNFDKLALDPDAPVEQQLADLAGSAPWRVSRVWISMRQQVELALHVLLGGRRTAQKNLRRCDFVLNYRTPEGEVGAALMLRPRKRLGRWEIRPKVIPPEVAESLRIYLAYVDRMVELASEGLLPQHPKRPQVSRLGPDAALIPATLDRPQLPFDPGSMFAGLRPSPRGNGMPALIPRIGPLPDHVPESERRYIGYKPHEYRRLAYQLAERAGEIWNEEHPTTGTAVHPPPALYGRALLDWTFNGQHDLLYGDRSSSKAIERLTARAIDGIWRLLASDIGLRRTPDVQAYQQELSELRTVELQLRELETQSNRVLTHHSYVRPVTRPRLDTRASEHDKLDLLLDQNFRQEKQLEELRQLVTAHHAVSQEVRRANQQRVHLLEKVYRLRYDQDRWLPIPDQDELPTQPDWDAIEAAALGATLGQQSANGIPVRDWLLFSEFASSRDIRHRSTVNRYAKGENLPPRPADRPWDAGVPLPIDESLGIASRRIWIPAVRPSFWRTELMQAERDRLLASWPEGRGWQDAKGRPSARCLAPLVLPDPHGTLYQRTGLQAGGPS
jgi:hypothetical protein